MINTDDFYLHFYLLPANTQLRWASLDGCAIFDDGIFLNTAAGNRVDDESQNKTRVSYMIIN